MRRDLRIFCAQVAASNSSVTLLVLSPFPHTTPHAPRPPPPPPPQQPPPPHTHSSSSNTPPPSLPSTSFHPLTPFHAPSFPLSHPTHIARHLSYSLSFSPTAFSSSSLSLSLSPPFLPPSPLVLSQVLPLSALSRCLVSGQTVTWHVCRVSLYKRPLSHHHHPPPSPSCEDIFFGFYLLVSDLTNQKKNLVEQCLTSSASSSVLTYRYRHQGYGRGACFL